MNSCHGCLKAAKGDFCGSCLRALFKGRDVSHILPFSKPEYRRKKLEQAGRISISGVQTKHSLRLAGKRLELTDRDGEYILKPIPFGDLDHLPQMPANEHVSMQLARQVFGLQIALNALVQFRDGEPAYLTKRFDRNPDGTRIQQEDFAQIAEMTEETHGKDYKYGLSYEEIGGLIKKNVGPYAVESEKFFRLVLFNYLIHNGDAHIKNFSLLRDPEQGILLLTPAYDLANTRIHLPHESDTALDLFKDGFATESFRENAFLAKDDFMEFGRRLGLKEARVAAALAEFAHGVGEMEGLLARSFLEAPLRRKYLELARDRAGRLAYGFSGRKGPRKKTGPAKRKMRS